MYAAIKKVEYNPYRDHDAVDRVRVLGIGDTPESAKKLQRRKAAAARIRSTNPPKKRKPPPPNEPWDTGLF